MCLAIPMRVSSISGRIAVAESAGVRLEVALDLLDDVSEGDYVIVHAGYAIQRLDAEQAHETLAILERLAGAEEE